jgi:hypothetical protein
LNRRRTISISHLAHNTQVPYLLKALVRIWESRGFQIVIGSGYSADADVCILHHDRTRLDAATLPSPSSGVPVVNGSALDISKRLYSTLRLGPSDDWAGPVIVKTDQNHFGEPERAGRGRALLDCLRKKLARYSWRLAGVLPPRTYPILQSVEKVPTWVWDNPELLVERFLPEREGDLYAIRGWVFFGDNGFGYRLLGREPIVKARTMVKREWLEETPEEIRAYRDKLEIDFGRFDYVVHDGRAILLDANKPPVAAGKGDSPNLTSLAQGIEGFLA